MTEEERNIALCTGIREAINYHDLSRIDEVMAPDFQDHHPGIGAGVSDREHYKQALRYVHETLDMKAEVLFTLAKPPYVVTRVKLTGTHIGPFMGIPATQRKVEWSTIEIYRADNGQLKERWALDDMAGLLKQLNVAIPL